MTVAAPADRKPMPPTKQAQLGIALLVLGNFAVSALARPRSGSWPLWIPVLAAVVIWFAAVMLSKRDGGRLSPSGRRRVVLLLQLWAILELASAVTGANGWQLMNCALWAAGLGAMLAAGFTAAAEQGDGAVAKYVRALGLFGTVLAFSAARLILTGP